MNAGTENRKKTIIAGSLGALALIAVLYQVYGFVGGSDTPKPPAPPVIKDNTPAAQRVTTSSISNAAATRSNSSAAPAPVGAAVAPGVAATKLASASTALDPTLDEAAMLRTESLVYGGTGRNIFSATYTPPPAAIAIPKAPPARPGPPVVVAPPVPPPYVPPPINLKFFGTIKAADGRMQAFFLAGDDVYLAREGDIVSRKYKIVSIGANSARVEDLQNNNTQSLPLQQ